MQQPLPWTADREAVRRSVRCALETGPATGDALAEVLQLPLGAVYEVLAELRANGQLLELVRAGRSVRYYLRPPDGNH